MSRGERYLFLICLGLVMSLSSGIIFALASENWELPGQSLITLATLFVGFGSWYANEGLEMRALRRHKIFR